MPEVLQRVQEKSASSLRPTLGQVNEPVQVPREVLEHAGLGEASLVYPDGGLVEQTLAALCVDEPTSDLALVDAVQFQGELHDTTLSAVPASVASAVFQAFSTVSA